MTNAIAKRLLHAKLCSDLRVDRAKRLAVKGRRRSDLQEQLERGQQYSSSLTPPKEDPRGDGSRSRDCPWHDRRRALDVAPDAARRGARTLRSGGNGHVERGLWAASMSSK
ncbi:MAG TPA: hypothetical protein VNN80_06880, partial [Polyangiaceae bacterium]|nr:hypothetical protein [Polyangiaceae bacterium]